MKEIFLKVVLIGVDNVAHIKFITIVNNMIPDSILWPDNKKGKVFKMSYKGYLYYKEVEK